MTTVMITGVGAIIGYGLLRSIRSSRSEVRLVGADIYNDAVGRTWCDEFEQAPLTASEDYFEWLADMVEKHHVDLIVPGIEQDVHRLSADRGKLVSFKCKVALNDPYLIDLTRDKWLMHQSLFDLDEATRIPSYLGGSYLELSTRLGLPFILKPRRSYASKGIVRVEKEQDFLAVEDMLGEHLMAQPLIGSDDEEYTVGAFGDGEGGVCAHISMQRYLAKDGSTAKAWIRNKPDLNETVLRLCSYFKPLGPTNLQFRLDNGCWKLLEINPRVSSTSSMRTAFGYNEASMIINYYLGGKLPVQPEIKEGYATRYIEDHVVYDCDYL